MANSDTSIIINIGNTCEALKSWHSINDWIARVTFQFASVRSAPGQSGNAEVQIRMPRRQMILNNCASITNWMMPLDI